VSFANPIKLGCPKLEIIGCVFKLFEEFSFALQSSAISLATLQDFLANPCWYSGRLDRSPGINGKFCRSPGEWTPDSCPFSPDRYNFDLAPAGPDCWGFLDEMDL
jgi:hypothetical protein